LAVSKDGTKLFALSYNDDTLTVLDAGTLDILKSFNLSLGSALAVTAGRADRLYISKPELVKIFNAETGEDIGEISLDNSGGMLAISPDNNFLYVGDSSPQTNIYKIDVSTDQAQIVAQRGDQYVSSIQLSPDGQRLYVHPVSANLVEVWDAADLSFSSQVVVPRIDPYRDEVFDLFATPSKLYVSFTLSVREASLNAAGRVTQFDAATLQPLRNWNFVRVPAIVISGNEQFLYAFTDKARVIDLQ
jgi:DNA-binding beta-propeller fold protein YncE